MELTVNKIVIVVLMLVIAAIVITLMIFVSPSMRYMLNQSINAANKSVTSGVMS